MYFIQLSTDAQPIERAKFMLKMVFSDRLGGTAKEKIGCIEIGDNVFIGSNTTILGNVRIGSNVIVGACSLINKDVPDNSVVDGVPAKVIGSFDEFVHHGINENTYPNEFHVVGEAVDDKFARWLWTEFYRTREKKWEK